MLAELLRRIALAPHNLPDADNLTAAADSSVCRPRSPRAFAVKAPQRGEVWLVDLGLAAKVRPALVISVPANDEDRALVTIVPHTTSPRGSRFEAARSSAVPPERRLRCPESRDDSARQAHSLAWRIVVDAGGCSRTCDRALAGIGCWQPAPRSNKQLEPAAAGVVREFLQRAAAAQLRTLAGPQ